MISLNDAYSQPGTLMGYIRSTRAFWYWFIFVWSLATTISVFIIPPDAYPIVVVRYILGSLFVLFLPGFSLIKVLFPKYELDNTQRIGLSVGASLALAPLITLFLNYTPFGIGVTSIIFALLAFTVSFATVAVIREYRVLIG